MMNNIVNALRTTRNFVNKYDESIPVISFDELNLKDLRSLTPYKVSEVLANRWLPNGMIAWRLNEGNNKLSMVFFRGRAAVVTETSNYDLELNELFEKASSLAFLESKKVVSMWCV
jgi:hypothetical protein